LSDIFRPEPSPDSRQNLLTMFFGRSVESCSVRTAPLYAVLKDTGWDKKKNSVPNKLPDFVERRTQRQQDAFEDLRAALADPVHMVPPRTGARKHVVSDASNLG
jgi:hypothetical protein